MYTYLIQSSQYPLYITKALLITHFKNKVTHFGVVNIFDATRICCSMLISRLLTIKYLLLAGMVPSPKCKNSRDFSKVWRPISVIDRFHTLRNCASNVVFPIPVLVCKTVPSHSVTNRPQALQLPKRQRCKHRATISVTKEPDIPLATGISPNIVIAKVITILVLHDIDIA